MYIMYVDESGDPGAKSPVRHYILSALIIPSVDWQTSFERHHQMRRQLNSKYHFPVRAELHASALVDTRHGGSYVRRLGGRKTRMRLFQDVMQSIPSVFPTAKVISIFVDKDKAENSLFKRENYLTLAWDYLANRYHRFLEKDCGNAPGIIVGDDTANVTVRALLRKMRVHNLMPSRYSPEGFYNAPVKNIIEDPFFRQSHHSYFVQMVDMISHSLYRKLYVKGSYRRYNLHAFFNYLEPIVLKSATTKDPENLGIVRIP
ncbi:MAG: hypothetical protein B6I38_08765 [Anaerolineaceae bacterium 4572_5.1]|nr:MAG: hypothetical protein B5M51_05770 [Anaerolinea sp. 4484_236]OQY28850.1 MAG: hypothetical protein B6I38_08765 [Anaerolineaceae bacterium 4572_5.1]